ncbi:MAG: hypothetical protein IT208_05460 [Chthonomonadales bacterium]|nr:hypothetical protein [Chthonomonadales bacterium]
MSTEFERQSVTIGGRAITVTSWYNESARCWSASAPAYSHLLTQRHEAGAGFASRGAATADVVQVLTRHFDRQ